MRYRLLSLCLLGVVCGLVGCSSGPSPRPEIGVAYAGPVSLKLRRDIDPRSQEVASVGHGERLGIIGRRRRFVKVRTTKGVEGWTDLRQLLGAADMTQLNELAEVAKKLPSQGAATVYEALNVHTVPNRLAPSFYRIKEGELCDVVAHELSPRVAFGGASIMPATPKKAPAPKKRKEDDTRIRPPVPPPPRLPDNWLELSKSPVLPPDPDDEPEPPKPTPIDDWSLVRLSNGRAGWVLTAALKMNIPDEVAQYSEGHRITSYFRVGEVRDGGQVKYEWLWTTLSTQKVPYEFDSFRLFIWNTRRHRYETAYVQRNLKGYYPVEVHPVEASFGKSTGKFPGFSLIVEEDGVRYRVTYAYQFYIVRRISKELIESPPAAQPGAQPAVANEAPPAKPPAKPDDSGIGSKLRALKESLFGKPKK